MTAAVVVEQIADDPSVLGLGDLDVLHAPPPCRAGQVSFRLLDPVTAGFYVVELVLGPVDDRSIIRLVERWAAERKRHGHRRCVAVLVAAHVEPRYRNLLRLIGGAVPLLVMEALQADGVLRFIKIG